MTAGEMSTSITSWMREDLDGTTVLEAISDSITSIWETLVCISLSELLGGPVTINLQPSTNLATNMTTATLPVGDPSTEGGDEGEQNDIWYIHSMSLKVTDGTERFWEGTEVGSELWRKFARTAAGASPFQPYVYDFDGKKFSVAPNVAQALTPGYFYVKRPSTTVVAGTVIPFNHPGVIPFVRYNAISLLKLSLEEYEASSRWGAKAEQERQAIITTSARKDARKNLRVQPIFK